MDWSGRIPEGHVLVECEDCRCFHHISEKEFDEFQEEIAEVLGQRIVRCWNCGEPAEEHELEGVGHMDEDDFLCQDCIDIHQMAEDERQLQDTLLHLDLDGMED